MTTAQPHPDLRIVGLRIATIRKARGMTQAELARQLGVTRPTIANLETGRSNMSVLHLQHLVRILGCRVGQVVAEEELPEEMYTLERAEVVSLRRRASRLHQQAIVLEHDLAKVTREER